MMVTWVTLDNYTNESVVEYGVNRLDQIAYGYNFKFRDGGLERRVLTIHRVLLTNLTNGQLYSKQITSTFHDGQEIYILFCY